MKQFNNQYLTEYYIDFNTPNKSFLKIAAVLYEKGIDNFFFHMSFDYYLVPRVGNPSQKKITKDEVN